MNPITVEISFTADELVNDKEVKKVILEKSIDAFYVKLRNLRATYEETRLEIVDTQTAIIELQSKLSEIE